MGKRGQKRNLSFGVSLERLFIYMFQKVYKVPEKKKQKPKISKKEPRNNYNMCWITREEQQEDLQGPWKKEIKNMRLEKFETIQSNR